MVLHVSFKGEQDKKRMIREIRNECVGHNVSLIN